VKERVLQCWVWSLWSGNFGGCWQRRSKGKVYQFFSSRQRQSKVKFINFSAAGIGVEKVKHKKNFSSWQSCSKVKFKNLSVAGRGEAR